MLHRLKAQAEGQAKGREPGNAIGPTKDGYERAGTSPDLVWPSMDGDHPLRRDISCRGEDKAYGT
jgi:hypothetical protein